MNWPKTKFNNPRSAVDVAKYPRTSFQVVKYIWNRVSNSSSTFYSDNYHIFQDSIIKDTFGRPRLAHIQHFGRVRIKCCATAA